MFRWDGTTLLAVAVMTASSAAHADDAPVRAYDQPLPASAKTYTVNLTVLDDKASEPLAGAEVRILNHVDSTRHNFRTDSRGRLLFECPSLHDEPSGRIEIRKSGYVPLGYGWGFGGEAKPPGEITLRLRRGTTMGGIVVAAADRPVEGVTVVMTVAKYGPGKRADNPTGYESYFEIPARTGPDGRWRTDSVPPGAEVVNLQLIHPDFVSDGSTTLWPGRRPNIAALRDQSDRQVLLKGVKISGRVVDDQGRPISGARIVDATRGLSFLEYVWRGVTDAEGRFHLHLPRGRTVNLTVESKGRQPLTQEISPDPDLSTVEFRLLLGKRLRGRVVDPLGHPVADAFIDIVELAARRGYSFKAQTDAQGRFEWDSAPEGRIAVAVRAAGFLNDGIFWLTASDEESAIALKPAVDVRFHAVDARTGEAIPRYRIRIGTQEPGTKGWHWRPPTGRSAPKSFQAVLDATQGPYQIEVSAAGYAPVILHLPTQQMVLREVVRLEKADK